MDLAAIGEVAGIGGIAVGALVLIFRSAIDRALILTPKADRTRLVSIIVACSFAVAVFGIGAWLLTNAKGGNIVTSYGDQSPATVTGKDVNITIGDSHSNRSGVQARRKRNSRGVWVVRWHRPSRR